MIAAYGGVEIFGNTCLMCTYANPRAASLQVVFGKDGLALLDGGFRGRVTFASGQVFAEGGPGLAAFRATAAALKDGFTRSLFDTEGVTWPSAVLEVWDLRGRVVALGDGRVMSSFRAMLWHPQ